jgi:ubiquinone/menaquinone biosynthesis C-methylase UbiE
MYRLHDYGAMLHDRRRIDAYARALSSVITPSSVVLDLGAGVGTFGIIACKLGAARVYSVDPADVITVAEEVARANGLASRMHFIQACARELDLPEKVNVIVSDLSGALPLFEEHIPSVAHARERFLIPGGVMIPATDRLLCAPLSNDGLYARIIEPWRSMPDVDFGPAEAMILHTPHALPVQPSDLAAEPRLWATLDYTTIASPNVSGFAEWTVETTTVIHGVALWFESTLYDDIAMSSGPWSAGSVHATVVLPLLAPMRVGEGEQFRVTIEAILTNGQYVVTWRASTSREPGARQTTFLSEPRSAKSLAARGTVLASARSFLDTDTLRPSDHVVARSVGDEILLLDLATGVYHVLNDTGARIWELLSRGESVTAVAQKMAADYDVGVQQAREDVERIMAQMTESALIRW